MKKTLLLVVVFCLMKTFLLTDTVAVIDINSGIDFYEKMANNNLFIKRASDIGFDSKGNVLILDSKYGCVFHVNKNSGKLIKTISSRGQGPGELQMPREMSVKNDLIFVLDKGYMGVKIFELNGKLVKEFKTGFFVGDIDVSRNNEIYLREINITSNTIVSVYNLKGKKLRNLVHFDGNIKDDSKDFAYVLYSNLALDYKENIIILYYLQRKIAKYDKKGKILWEKKIENEILEKYPKLEKAKYIGKGRFNITYSVFGMDVTRGNDIVVGHAGGGVIFDKNGISKHLIQFSNKKWSLKLFKFYKKKLFYMGRYGYGRDIRVFNINFINNQGESYENN